MSPRACSPFLTLVLAFVAIGTAGAQTSQSKLDRALRAAARSDVNTVRVIVQTRPGTRAELKRALQAHGDVVDADHPLLDALSVTVHRQDLNAFESNPNVVAVSVDAEVTSFANERASRRGADAAVDPLHRSLGLDETRFRGAGVNVAILDSGIEPNRDLASSLAGFWDFTRGGIPTRAFDDYGHGTHVAGLIASAGVESGNEFSGVAPGVQLYGLKVLDKHGRGRASHVVRALEWVVANKISDAPGAVKIDIVNLSLGHPIYEPAESDPLVQAVEKAVRAGIVVVTAAGNHGQAADGTAGSAGITSPGNAPSAITVGASDSRNTADHRDDRMAWFSSHGPTWFDGFAKPDVVAPGVALASDLADRGSLVLTYPEIRLSSKRGSTRFARLSGTSMAAAVATGVASLALEASRHSNHHDAGLTPNALKAVLQYTALPVQQADGQPYEALAQGAGQVNGHGAIALALAINLSTPAGHSWLRGDVSHVSAIAGVRWAWSESLIWKDSVVRNSDALFVHSTLWDDNIVWGTGCDTDDATCLAMVWGAAADADNIVWGTGLAWADDIVWGNRVVGQLLDDDNIVWGTIAGLTEDNIVWGTLLADDNIVWGTVARRDSTGAPLWGSVADDDNIVWGTVRGDNIVWGTLRGDNIVWGTVHGGSEGGRQ